MQDWYNSCVEPVCSHIRAGKEGESLVALALFLLWILFNGKFTWELAAFGAAISIALAWFVQRFIMTGFTLKKQWIVARHMPDYLRYGMLLVREIALATFSVMRMILSDRDVIVPKLASFTADLKTMPALITLADSITLTPGTITVHHQGNEYLVHCLDEGMEEGLHGSGFEKMLKKIEAIWEKEPENERR